MTKLTEFGKEMRKIRIDRQELLKDMANVIGVSATFLSAVETGKKKAPVDFIDRLALNYKLSTGTIKKLERMLAKSRTEIKMKLPAGTTLQQREVAAVFARRFQNLDPEQVKHLMEMLREGDEDGSD